MNIRDLAHLDTTDLAAYGGWHFFSYAGAGANADSLAFGKYTATYSGSGTYTLAKPYVAVSKSGSYSKAIAIG